MAVISHSALKAAFKFGVWYENTNHQLWKASDIVVITRCLTEQSFTSRTVIHRNYLHFSNYISTGKLLF